MPSNGGTNRLALATESLPATDLVNVALAAEIGTALSAATEMKQLVALLRKHLKWLLHFEAFWICLPVEGVTFYQLIDKDGREDRHTVDASLVAWTLRHCTTLDLSDLSDRSSWPPDCHLSSWLPTIGSLLVLPLTADRRVLGALVIHSSRVNAFASLDRGLLGLLSLQVMATVRTVLLLADLDGAQTIITGMARAVEAKDPYTRGHSDRVTNYALSLARAARLPIALQALLRQIGPLHDLGKIGVPDAILQKPGPLLDAEMSLLRRHPEIGDEICVALQSLQRVRPGIRHHHERYDGGGYPDRLAGDAIPLEARVLAIADAYDAMTSDRPYRRGMPRGQALAILRANEGPQWDPELIAIFCSIDIP